MMDGDDQVHVRARRSTRSRLKLLAVLLGETMSDLLDRLVLEEAHRRLSRADRKKFDPDPEERR